MKKLKFFDEKQNLSDLHELYRILLEGTIGEDYDNDWKLVGSLGRFLAHKGE
jgi:hypothetical protein